MKSSNGNHTQKNGMVRWLIKQIGRKRIQEVQDRQRWKNLIEVYILKKKIGVGKLKQNHTKVRKKIKLTIFSAILRNNYIYIYAHSRNIRTCLFDFLSIFSPMSQ